MSNYFKEVAEANETSETEKKKTSTAFENDKKADAKEVKRVHTINEQYEGKNYPGTNVEYKRVRIQYHGEKLRGYFLNLKEKTERCYQENYTRHLTINNFRIAQEHWRKKLNKTHHLLSNLRLVSWNKSRTANLGYPV